LSGLRWRIGYARSTDGVRMRWPRVWRNHELWCKGPPLSQFSGDRDRINNWNGSDGAGRIRRLTSRFRKRNWQRESMELSTELQACRRFFEMLRALFGFSVKLRYCRFRILIGISFLALSLKVRDVSGFWSACPTARSPSFLEAELNGCGVNFFWGARLLWQNLDIESHSIFGFRKKNSASCWM
jgi:hypothetical protein